MIPVQEKQQIANKLKTYCERYESQNKAAKSISDTSSATLSHILARKWDLIKDEMWRNIASQIGFSSEGWVMVKTRDFKRINYFLADSQANSHVFAITGDAGVGKSKAAKAYAEENKNCYVLSCNEYWNRKFFLSELLQEMGQDSSGLTVAEMMSDVVRTLKKEENPIIVMDEADKLTDQVLYFFITLYNQLEDQCGLILMATDHLSKRIRKGLKLNKKGYKEIYSRIGSNFIELEGVGSSDVAAICIENGIENKATIKQIWGDCEEDLRRVKILIHKSKLLIKKEEA